MKPTIEQLKHAVTESDFYEHMHLGKIWNRYPDICGKGDRGQAFITERLREALKEAEAKDET